MTKKYYFRLVYSVLAKLSKKIVINIGFKARILTLFLAGNTQEAKLGRLTLWWSKQLTRDVTSSTSTMLLSRLFFPVLLLYLVCMCRNWLTLLFLITTRHNLMILCQCSRNVKHFAWFSVWLWVTLTGYPAAVCRSAFPHCFYEVSSWLQLTSSYQVSVRPSWYTS